MGKPQVVYAARVKPQRSHRPDADLQDLPPAQGGVAEVPTQPPQHRTNVMVEDNAARKFAEKAATQAKDTAEKVTATTQDVSKALEATSSKLAEGAQHYTGRLLEIARANSNAAFDYAQALLGARSPTEIVELANEYAKAHLAALKEQTKELGAIAQKVDTEAAEPIKTGVTKAFNPTARA